MNWKEIELLGHVYYAKQGYRILVSLVENHGYDFVAEKNGRFIRVNVKTAGLKDKNDKESWSIAEAGGSTPKKKQYPSEVDVYLVWVPTLDKFIEMPGDFLDNMRSKSRRIPKKFYNRELRLPLI